MLHIDVLQCCKAACPVCACVSNCIFTVHDHIHKCSQLTHHKGRFAGCFYKLVWHIYNFLLVEVQVSIYDIAGCEWFWVISVGVKKLEDLFLQSLLLLAGYC